MAKTAQGSAGNDLQAVIADHTKRLGTTNGTGASLTVPSGSSIESDDAPHDGMVVVTIASGLTVRVRIEPAALADANDQAYIGPDTHHWPIVGGERVSFHGDTSSGTVTISMVKQT